MRLLKDVHRFIVNNNHDNEGDKKIEGVEEHTYRVDHQTGWRFYPAKSQETRRVQHLRLCPRTGSITIFGRREVGILGKPHPGLTFSSGHFGCRQINFTVTHGRCK